jgi:hypothetical protein
MKNYSIHSGNFSANGNFSGYTALGERLFIHKTQMAGLGWASQEQVKFPFYAIGAEKMIGQLDADRNPLKNADGTLVQVARLQALSIFPNKEALTSAHVDTATLDIEIKSAIKASASAAGLSEESISSLVNAAI